MAFYAKRETIRANRKMRGGEKIIFFSLVMRITDIEASPAEAEAYSYVRSILQNSHSLVNGKLEHHE